MSVSLVGVSASPVPTCSAASCGIWHPLKSPPPLLYRHTLTHTNTSTISWDKLGFCDFLQILPLIRENNLKALHRKRHEYKEPFWKATGEKKNTTKVNATRLLAADVMIGHNIILSYYISFGFCTPQLHSLLKLVYHIAGNGHYYITGAFSESVTIYFWKCSFLSVCNRSDHNRR